MGISRFSFRGLFPAEYLSLIKTHRARLGFGLVLLLMTVATQLAYPWLVAYFIDHVRDGIGTYRLIVTVAVIVTVMVLQAAAIVAHSYLFSSVGTETVFRIRTTLFGAMLRQEIGFFDKENIGGLMSRLTSDVEQLRLALSGYLGMLMQSLLTLAGSVVMLMMLSPALSLSLLLAAPPLLFVMRWTGGRMRAQSGIRQQKLAESVHVAQEAISNIRLVHAYNQQDFEAEKYTRAAASAMTEALSCNRVSAELAGSLSLLQGLMVLILVGTGLVLVQRHALTIGSLAGFLIYAVMITGAASTVSLFWSEWMQSIGATRRVFEIIGRGPETRTRSEKAGPALRGNVEFRNVTFAYPARPEQLALDAFDLSVAQGEKIALVGPSGAGKSTVINLLLGFYEPLSGAIRFDGHGAEALSLPHLRKHIGIVEQEPALFAGSIIDNIRYAVPNGRVDEEDVIRAAKHANVHEFVATLPMGYETLVGTRGLQLSGGQKQRIAIARALLRDPRILILDEATSALDSENEEKVQIALQRLMEGRTTIIVSHRLSTISYADRLIVMSQGRVVQSGTHHQLTNDKAGHYHTLMRSQLSSERRPFERQGKTGARTGNNVADIEASA